MSNNPMDTDRNLPLPSYPDQYGVLQNSRPQEAAPDFVLEDYPSMDTTIDQPFPNQQQQSSVTFSQNIPADQRNQQGQQPMNQQQFSRQQQYSHQQQQQPAHQQPYQYQPAHQKLYQPGYQPAPGPTYVPSHHQAMPGLPGGLPANQTPQMQSLHNEYLIQPVYPSQRETSNLQMHSQSSRQYQHSPQSSAIQGDFLRKQAQTATERAIELVAELKRMRELNEDYQLQIKGLNQTITSKNNEIKKSNELLSAANRQNARFREMVANLRVKVEDLEQEKVAIIKSSDKSLREIESTLDNVLMHSLSKSRERGN
ncbi:MAG: hypothetical protein AB8B55_00185 [Mariniblastus sp.]